MTTMTRRSWADIRQYYLSFGEGLWLSRHQPMLNLIGWIEEQKLNNELFGTVGLSGLWLSDRPSQSWGEHVLQITMVTSDFMLFEYHRVPGSTDGMQKTVPVEESIECLRQFLAYKFGIHRSSKKETHQSPEPMASGGGSF